MANKHLIVILGMHRSGTSAMTRAISVFGDLPLPPRLLGPAHGNRHGHWEALDALELNDAFMRNYGSAAFDPGFHVQLRSTVVPEEANEFSEKIKEFFEKNFSGVDGLVLKEPRITALADLWLKAALEMGYRISIIFMVRHPEHVASSLYDRDRLPMEHAYALWLKYNLVGERQSRGFDRVFVEFERLQADWRSTLERVNRGLGLNFTLDGEKSRFLDEFVERDERAQVRPLGQSLTDRWIRTVYDWLQSAAADSSPGPAPMDQCFEDVVAAEKFYRISYDSYNLRFRAKPASPLIDVELQLQEKQMDLCEEILLETPPAASEKWTRILQKIQKSRLKGSGDLPDGFNALRYVTRYRDLFEAEVDPYQHYFDNGRAEQRTWETPRQTLCLSEQLQSEEILLSLYEAILLAEPKVAEKFWRIRQKIESSTYRTSPEIPADFKPVRYVCRHPDLFEFEVDPFEHYQEAGATEQRPWRFSE